ncbi:hypothetical protein IscW_ISCW003623, partial [Ixodes scapularis]
EGGQRAALCTHQHATPSRAAGSVAGRQRSISVSAAWPAASGWPRSCRWRCCFARPPGAPWVSRGAWDVQRCGGRRGNRARRGAATPR